MDASRPTSASAIDATVRHARDNDLPRLTEIYNHYILTTPITFDIEPYTVEQRREWLAQFAERGPHRLFVAEQDGVVLGYAGSHKFRDRRAYDTTIEVTIYCAPEATGRGIGALLYGALFDAVRDEDLRLAIAGMTLPNDASTALHERFGFTLTGVMHDVGRKFDRYWDVAWYEKRLQ
ncbi:MAG: N-acetyltransferase family protein [Dehalococcoidia bacterium]